jgi:ABC-2 type transport system permease protein
MFFPFTAAMTYMLKYAFTAIPFWHVLISLGILALSTVFVTWSAAKVFRWALLLYGKKPSIKTLWHVISGKQEIGIIPTKSSETEQGA